MTKEQYFKFHAECLAKMTAITKAKNADYTGTTSDPFANFTRGEALGIATTEQGFLTRMLDKMARLTSFSQKGMLEVKDESVEDTLLDLANYCVLFAGYLASKRPRPNTEAFFETLDAIDRDIKAGEQLEMVAGAITHGDYERRKNDWIAP